MSSGKPQTRGLAALLRIEKERRAREETEAGEAVTPESEGEQHPSAPHPFPDHFRATESDTEVLPDAAENVSDPPQENAGRPFVEAPAPPATAQHLQTAPVDRTIPESGEEQRAAAEKVASPFTSLPRTRPAAARPARVRRRKANSRSETALVSDPGWEKFVAEWKPFLREGVKLKLCEYFYRNTTALGAREFTTSTAQLSRVSGSHRRHIFLVLRQLEDLRFIQKETLGTNRKDQGILIRFFPDRQA